MTVARKLAVNTANFIDTVLKSIPAIATIVSMVALVFSLHVSLQIRLNRLEDAAKDNGAKLDKIVGQTTEDHYDLRDHLRDYPRDPHKCKETK